VDFSPVNARVSRLVECLPVLAALGLNAVAHDRWLFDAPLMLGAVAIALSGRSIEHRGGRMLLAGAVGLALGLGAFLLAPPPPGPIPPVLLSPLCLGLGALCVFCVASRNRTYAWVYAWLLAVLSANVPLTPPLGAALAALALATVLAVASAGQVLRAGARSVLGFSLFAALVGVATWQLSVLIRASEGWLMETVAQLTQGSGVRGLEPKSVDLPTRTTAPLSMDPLFELQGKPPRYLRTGVLEYFDGRRWWETQAARDQKLSLPGGEGESLEVSFLAPLDRTVPAPAGVRSARGTNIEARGGWVLQADAPGGTSVMLARGPEELPEEEPPLEDLPPLPEDVAAELAPLATELLGDAVTSRARAEALEKFFTANFSYSLTVDLKGQGHPLALLVRERRAAYCSYFASAMVALLRTQGTHARLVTGFAPAETNPLTGRTVVRARDAHAWVEVYLPDERRWAPFDPTPWSSRDAALLVERERGWASHALAAVASALRRAWAMVRYTPGAAVVAVTSSPVTWVLVALAAAFVFRRRLRFGKREKRAGLIGPVEPRLRDAYQRYATLLGRAGLQRAPHETDDEVLHRLKERAPPQAAQAAERFVHAFRRERFRAPEAAQLDEALKTLETALADVAPR
jgi:protein-glutamine gamma-glutamyltransferase